MRLSDRKNHHLLRSPNNHVAQHTDLPARAGWLVLPPSLVSHSHNNHMSRRRPWCIVNNTASSAYIYILCSLNNQTDLFVPRACVSHGCMSILILPSRKEVEMSQGCLLICLFVVLTAGGGFLTFRMGAALSWMDRIWVMLFLASCSRSLASDKHIGKHRLCMDTVMYHCYENGSRVHCFWAHLWNSPSISLAGSGVTNVTQTLRQTSITSLQPWHLNLRTNSNFGQKNMLIRLKLVCVTQLLYTVFMNLEEESPKSRH